MQWNNTRSDKGSSVGTLDNTQIFRALDQVKEASHKGAHIA